MGFQPTASGLKLLIASMLSAAVLLFSLAANAAPPLSGAIFTTTVDGTVVNGNTIYGDKTEVYLDGGPGPNAPQQAAGLPDGDYYFQVTDPSGKQLLSTDPVECRKFRVTNGVITELLAPDGGVVCDPVHGTGVSMDNGNGITIQLTPYDDTPNNGGVYKVWVTPVGDGTVNGGGFVGDPAQVDNSCGNGCFHGFIPARSKTDNFKVGDKEPTFCILVRKDIIDTKKELLEDVEEWPISIEDSVGVINGPFWTPVEQCGLVAGTYTVEEGLPDGYTLLQVVVDGKSIEPPSTSVQVMLKRNNGDVRVLFKNEETGCDKDCKKN